MLLFSALLGTLGCSETGSVAPDAAGVTDANTLPPSGADTPSVPADAGVDAQPMDTNEPDVSPGDMSDGEVDIEGPSEDALGPEDVVEDVPPPATFGLSCSEDDDCVVACATGSCVEGECAFESPQAGCVIKDPAKATGWCVASGQAHPQSACLFCNADLVTEGWTGLFLTEGFEMGLGTLATSNLSGSKAKWALSEKRAYAGTTSLYFGDVDSASYDVEAHAHGRATSPTLLVPEGITPLLTFALWLDTEQTPGYDFLRVIFIAPDGAEEELWHSDSIGGTTNGGFIPIKISLPEGIGQGVRIAFEFNTVDELINMYEGAYIDAIRATSGCCGVDADCDDGDACTLDVCPGEGLTCAHEAVAGCCNTSAECDDGSLCTVDTCTGPGGTCEHQLLPECCESAAACNDGDPCTEDLCDASTATCTHQPLCCTEDAQCSDGDTCTVGSCVEGQCAYEFVCCLSDTECDDSQYCTQDQCIGGDCVHSPALLPGCCFPEILNLTFEEEDDTAGWMFDSADGGVGWQVAAVGAPPSGPNALYYGNPAQSNFSSGSATSGAVLSVPYDLPTDVEIHLKLKVYIDSESSSSYDKFWLKIKTPAKTITVIQKSNLTQKLWKPFDIDITYLGGQTIQLEFSFDTVDGISNDGLGLLVDDLLIETTCEVKTCQSNGQCPSKDTCVSGSCQDGVCAYANSCCQSEDECDDDLVCTNDSCSGGQCKFNAIAECCETDFNCDDGNACTIDACSGVGGTCSNTAIDGCCLNAGDCDDGDGCTVEACDGQVCGWTNVCCASDAECNDGDDVCTTDACVDEFCTFTPTGVEGCCEANPVDWDFETPVPLTITESTYPCTWQVAAAGMSKSGSNSLYYGDLATGDYKCSGANSGTATTDNIALMPGYGYTLRFDLFMDTEGSTTYDKLFVYALVDGKKWEIWSKSKLSQAKAWTSHVINLNAWAGKTLQLEFYFDTKDGVLNTTSGVYIDDLKVQSTCAIVACAGNPECNDGFGFSNDTCDAGACAYTLP